MGAIPRIDFMFVLADMIDIDKTDEHFRLLYDVKGRFVLHRVTKLEAAVRFRLSSFFRRRQRPLKLVRNTPASCTYAC